MGNYLNSQYDPHGRSRWEPTAQPPAPRAPTTNDADFDILEWYPAYENCQQYFLDHAQHEPGTQALCALINIRLPFQSISKPITSSSSSAARSGSSTSGLNGANTNTGGSSSQRNNSGSFISLVPYIRRLVVTGFDKPAILHGFFGDSYKRGILPHLDCERRNYLFAAKHGGWRSCKKQYDVGSGLGTGSNGNGGGPDETVPFMKPLDEAKIEELVAAEKAWSDWLCMEDWILGPRAHEGQAAEQHQQQQQQQQRPGPMQGQGGGRPMAQDQLPDGVPDELGEHAL